MNLSQMLKKPEGCGAVLLAVFAPFLLAQNASPSLDWDAAFADRSGVAPLHFTAEYTGQGGTHRLEQWRTGVTHLRRRTDDRIDLHVDAATGGKDPGYVWQILDLRTKVDNRISDRVMFKAGMFYNFYSMAHVLSRPAGRFQLTALAGEPAPAFPGQSCTWYVLAPDGQPMTKICWSAELGIPLETLTYGRMGEVATRFQLRTVDRKPIPAGVFAVNLTGIAVHDHDAMADDD